MLGSFPSNPAVSRKLTIGFGVCGPEGSPAPPALPGLPGTAAAGPSSVLRGPPPILRSVELASNGPWIERLFFGMLDAGGAGVGSAADSIREACDRLAT